MLRFSIMDYTGVASVSCFHDEAVKIVSTDARTLMEYHNNGNTDKVNKVFREACANSFHFKIAVTTDIYEV